MRGLNPDKGIPLGNVTSQIFANIYLNELDQFIKHKLKAEYLGHFSHTADLQSVNTLKNSVFLTLTN